MIIDYDGGDDDDDESDESDVDSDDGGDDDDEDDEDDEDVEPFCRGLFPLSPAAERVKNHHASAAPAGKIFKNFLFKF